MRIVTFLINNWLMVKDHLKRSFSFKAQEIYSSLEQLSQISDLSERLIIVIGTSLDPGVVNSSHLSSLSVRSLEMIEPLMLALLREGQHDLLLIVNQTKHIACLYELNCSLSDPNIASMRRQALIKMKARLKYLSSAFGVPVFIIEK